VKRTFLLGLIVAACGLLPPRPKSPNEPSEDGGEGGTASGGRAGSGRGGALSGSAGNDPDTGGTATGGDDGGTAGENGGGSTGNSTGAGSGGKGGIAGGESGAGGDGGRSIREDEIFRPLPVLDPIAIAPVEAVVTKHGPGADAYNLVDLLWVASDRFVRHVGLTPNGFSTTALVAGPTDFSPLALPRSDGLTDVFMTLDDGGMRTGGWINGRWAPEYPTPWNRFSAPVRTALSGTTWSPDHLDVFGLDLAGGVHHIPWRSAGSMGAWSAGWRALPGVTAEGTVSAAALAGNTIHLFVRTTNGELARGSYVDGNGPTAGWEVPSICGDEAPPCPCNRIKEAPAVTALDDSELAIVFRSSDDSLWLLTSNADTSTCEPLGVSSSRPPVLMLTPARLVLFHFDSAGFVTMTSRGRASSVWSSSKSLDQKLTDLAVASVDSARSYLFGRTDNGTIVYRALYEEP
jgi:hypothetical protein